jgi:glycosyl-4,4'-diaponeurosporenoate acyltransferase
VSDATVVLVDAGVWALWSTIVGYGAHRMPLHRLDHDGPITRLRRWERSGRAYEHIAIRRWKDLLPELGAAFRGGMSKRGLPSRAIPDLARFASETRRAELVHWAIPALTPVFALWNPPLLLAAMAAYAVVANLPCLVVQRYNRGRLLRVMAARARRAGTSGTAGSAGTAGTAGAAGPIGEGGS